MAPLLMFIFDFLGHSKGKPLVASKIDVTTLTLENGESSLQELQGFLCHLYYLSSLYTSAITKTWWMECKSRQVVQNVETWTAKYISPHVHAAALSEVRTWAAQQNSMNDDGKPLTIKTNAQVGEVSAAYSIGNEDEERSVSILVTLPPSFPLHSARVSSLRMTSFSEQRWAAWLRSAQGVMAFSNNNIVDGLLAWKRNIVGALQGQSECTICYSLVSEDGKLPSKKCSTCKNTFHLLCLTKWFSSSGDRKCPLCRQDFTGMGRVDRRAREGDW